MPDPPATRKRGSSAAAPPASHTKYPPIGPRTSIRSPTISTSSRNGDTSPSWISSTVTSNESVRSGSLAIE
jgi:hypothetical protein